jgi:hypothetical protein
VIAAVAVLSFVLTWVRARTGRLLPCFAIHAAFNGIQAIIIVAQPLLQDAASHAAERPAGDVARRARSRAHRPDIKTMTHEVVVVGAGIGGLTTAALLAARGVDVCVLEKESRGGGCATTFERFGYEFETTAGLYAGWGDEDIHARVYAELPVAPPRSAQARARLRRALARCDRGAGRRRAKRRW